MKYLQKFPWTRKPDFRNISKDVYPDFWAESGRSMRSKLMPREIIFMNWIPEQSSVASIGCGNSRLLYELKTRKKCDVIGIDIADSVLEGLAKNGIIAHKADISRKDFDCGTIFKHKVDYIIASEVLEHFAIPEELVGKMKPWTNYFVISVPNSAFYRYRLGLMFNGRFFTQWVKHPSEHLRFWSNIDFLDWLEAQDLKIIRRASSNGPAVMKDIWPNLFGHQICYLTQCQT